MERLEDPSIFEAAEDARNGGLERDELDLIFQIMEENVNEVFYLQVIHDFSADFQVLFALWKCCHAYMTILYSLNPDDGYALFSLEIEPIYERCNAILSTVEGMKRQMDEYDTLKEEEVDEPEIDEPEVDEPEVDEPEVDEPEVDEPEIVDLTGDEPPSKVQKTEETLAFSVFFTN